MQISVRPTCFVNSRAQASLRPRSRGGSNKKLISALVPALSFCALFAVVQPLRAEGPALKSEAFPSETYSELMSYVEQLRGEEPVLASAAGSPHEFTAVNGDDYSALNNFVREIGGQEAASSSAAPSPHHGAAAQDEDLSALRAFVREIGGNAPSAEDNRPIVLAQAEQAKPAPKPTPKPKVAATKANAKAVKAPVGDVEAVAVGSQVCMTCHAAQAASFGQTLMGKIGKVRRGTMECENCHGPGSLHVKAGGGRGVGGMMTFRNDDQRHTAEEYNAVCLACHEKGDRNNWRGSTHETRGLACTNCHTIMANVTPKFQLAKLTEMDTCFQCHKDKRAQIMRNGHMPLREGKMSCSNCHNPHGSYSESLLKEATINDTCYKCHAEKRGPFLFEHQPVRESCVNCHDPHGSVNDFMLKMSRPRICQQCHANLTGHPGNPRNPQSIYAINRECQNCHAQIHGSNNPSGPRFLR
jgi:DmsE family decaheme c-type cytochrome